MSESDVSLGRVAQVRGGSAGHELLAAVVRDPVPRGTVLVISGSPVSHHKSLGAGAGGDGLAGRWRPSLLEDLAAIYGCSGDLCIICIWVDRLVLPGLFGLPLKLCTGWRVLAWRTWERRIV